MTGPIYLDHAATAFPKAPGVAKAVAAFLDEDAGNPGRGGHRMTLRASRRVEGARASVGALLGCAPERVLFGPGATFWLNTLLQSLAPAGSRVVVSALEHNAVMRPLAHLRRERGLDLVRLAGTGPGATVTAEEVVGTVSPAPTALVVLCHASNVSGAVSPVERIAEAVAPVPVVVDGAQSAGVLPLDFDRTRLAAFVASGHKGLLGPPGTGVLLLSPGLEPEPLVRGGTGSRSESEEMPEFLPDRLEAGTPNGAGLAGLGVAAEWLREKGVEAVHAATTALAARLAQGLGRMDGARLVGYEPGSPRVAVVSFDVEGVDAGELAGRLDREWGIQLRMGLHCAPAAHRRLGSFPRGTLRAAFGPFNTAEDVDALIEALRRERTRA